MQEKCKVSCNRDIYIVCPSFGKTEKDTSIRRIHVIHNSVINVHVSEFEQNVLLLENSPQNGIL